MSLIKTLSRVFYKKKDCALRSRSLPTNVSEKMDQIDGVYVDIVNTEDSTYINLTVNMVVLCKYTLYNKLMSALLGNIELFKKLETNKNKLTPSYFDDMFQYNFSLFLFINLYTSVVQQSNIDQLNKVEYFVIEIPYNLNYITVINR